MKLEPDTLIFSTGKRLGVNCGIVGLSPELTLSEGYDAGIWEGDLTVGEQHELADHMIERWQKFKARIALTGE